MPATTPHRMHRVAAIAAAAAAAAVLSVAPTADAVPSEVLPTTGATPAEGSAVTLLPRAVRTEGGRAEVDVVLGAAAPGDVVVELRLTTPGVSQQGSVQPGPPSTSGRTTTGGRLRPGESLRVTLSDIATTVLLVARVHPAGDPDDGRTGSDRVETTELAAVVLPDGPTSPPTATIEVVDGELRGEVHVTEPLLVTARLRGAEVVTAPERLVLPDRPLVLTGAPARWPAPSELAVTDDAGRTATATTGRTALAAIGTGLLVAAALGTAVLLRRRRTAAA